MPGIAIKTLWPLAFENAQPVSMYKMEGDLHEQERDASKYWKNAILRLAMLGLENQSRYDGRMPLRLVGFDGAGYRVQYGGTGAAYPVITLVLNFSDKEWTSNKKLSDLVVYPEGTEEYLRPYFNDWTIHVVDVAYLEDDEIALFKSDFRAVADYLKKKRLDAGYCGNDQELKHVDEVMKLLAAITGDPVYVESLKFRKEGEAKTMDMHLRNMMNRNKAEGMAEGKAEAVMNLMDTMSFDLEKAMDAVKIKGEEKTTVRKIVEEKMQGVPA